MDIFNEFIFVEEKSFTNLLRCTRYGHPNYSIFISDVTQFASLEFKIDNIRKTLEIADIGTVSASSKVPLAQIIRWEWNEKGEQVIKETKILDIGGKLEFGISLLHLSSFVVRILKKREKTDQNPCPSLNSPDDGLTVQIGDEKITVSAQWLMSVSPVIQRMFSVEMKEKQQRLITLDKLGVDMEQFKEFLGYILLNALREQILPTPQNVLMLLKLADYFQIDWLKLRCDTHLISCIEIPLFDRFLLIGRYQLDNLKNYFLRLDHQNLSPFFTANCDQFLASASVFNSQFFADLIIRLSAK